MDYKSKYEELRNRISRLNEIGLALSTEKDTNVLFEKILEESASISNADGRTLYIVKDNNLHFEIMKTESLDIWIGGTSGKKINYAPVPMYAEDGKPNLKNVCAYAAISGTAVNIEDAYTISRFDFSGMKEFDKSTGFRSLSSLTVPMKNHENEILGVIQLINARDKDNKVISFSTEMLEEIESLTSQGAVTLSNKDLINDLKELFESFIKLIADSIDRKSPYTGGHCKRVPELTMMIAEALENQTSGKFKDFKMTEAEKYELKIAAWLHDCGKITTPVHVVDKSTKLETIYDRIHLIETRFEAYIQEEKIKFLKEKIKLLKTENDAEIKELEDNFNTKVSNLRDDLEFIKSQNLGSEYMPEEDIDRIREIGKKSWYMNGHKLPLLSKDEVYNLTIKRGTLNHEERKQINDHIIATIQMLNNLPYPKNLANVPEFAGGHHEKMDGTGYPLGLNQNEMSVQARVMAIADIYEALTAPDRPYKEGKHLSESMRILGYMRDDYHIDKDIFEVFVKEGIYKQYAEKFVPKKQIDSIKENELFPS